MPNKNPTNVKYTKNISNFPKFGKNINVQLIHETRAWVKRNNGPNEVVNIVPELLRIGMCYSIYTAFEENPDYLGRILFDTEGYWIYDGNLLTIAEQEQLAKFIINYVEKL